jgi:hypothetical protein
MDNRPSIDRELLVPILIGAFSILGIGVVLIVGRALNAPAEVAATPSATPFQYVYLGTEPAISTPLLEGSLIPPPPAATSEDGPLLGETPESMTPTRSGSVSTPLVLPSLSVTNTSPGTALRTNTPNRTPTPTVNSTAAASNTYDDADFRLFYTGNWVSQTNVSGAHQGTLHVSDTTGNLVSFTFTGQEIQLYYQPGTSLGTVTVTFDNETLAIPVNQSQGNGVWVYALDTAGSHTAIITHTGGGSVNIDKLVIPAPTATPTRTPTATP